VENRIALSVDPVCRICRGYDSQGSIFGTWSPPACQVSRPWRVPNPTMAAKWISGVAPFCILNKHESQFGSRVPVCVSDGHLRVLGSENFLHQDSSVGKFAGPAIRFRCAGSRVGGVHLVSL